MAILADPSKPTEEGNRLINQWEKTKSRVASLKQQLNSAECDMHNARNALGKWMCPGDAKEGESFCVWVGDGMLQVTFERFGDYKINWRKRPKR